MSEEPLVASDKDRRLPCPTCPWRKSVKRRGFPGGVIDTQRFARMVSGEFGSGMMQCHCSKDGKETAELCVGFALQVNYQNVGIRMLAMKEGRDIVDEDYCTDEPLHTIESLITKHGGK